MEPIVKIINEKCQICWACVRACPFKAIRIIDEKQPPEIMQNRCVACGSCVEACHVDAIPYKDSTGDVVELLKSGSKTVAIVSPSISGEFDDISDVRKLVPMIRKLGFTHVNDVSFGVDLVARKYADLFNNFKGKYYITTTCPVTYSYVEKYHPNLIGNLAPIVSPMIATAKIVRKKYGQDTKVVYISPNISSKLEARRSEGDGMVNHVITFAELRILFNRFDITESQLEFSEFDGPLGYRGLLFPISNGILQAGGISEDLVDGHVFTVAGKNRLLNAVKEFEDHLDIIHKHFNLVYEDSLVNPGSTKKYDKLIKEAMVIDFTRRRLKMVQKEQWEKDVESFSDIDLSCVFKEDDQRLPKPVEDHVRRILKSISIMNGEVQLNCTSCGYASCRDFAVAVNQGLTTINMCTTFSIRSKQNYIQKLRQTNEELVKIQTALKTSEQVSKEEHDRAIEAKEILSTMLQKLRSGVMIVDNKFKIIHSNEVFIHIIGKEAEDINEVIPGLVGANIKSLIPLSFQNLISYVIENDEPVLNRDIDTGNKKYNVSVFTIMKNKVAGAIVRDLAMPDIQKEAVISKLKEVIDKNLTTVQQLGYILGESAAETEEMLRSIISSFDQKKRSDENGQ